MKILQDVKIENSNNIAFAGKKFKKKSKGTKCYACNNYGHIAKKWLNQQNQQQGYGSKKKAIFSAFAANHLKKDEWYFDSGPQLTCAPM